MNRYPCVYCGGHPRLVAEAPVQANVMVMDGSLIIETVDQASSVSLDSVLTVINEIAPASDGGACMLKILAKGHGRNCAAELRIELRFENACFGRALALRLKCPGCGR